MAKKKQGKGKSIAKDYVVLDEHFDEPLERMRESVVIMLMEMRNNPMTTDEKIEHGPDKGKSKIHGVSPRYSAAKFHFDEAERLVESMLSLRNKEETLGRGAK